MSKKMEQAVIFRESADEHTCAVVRWRGVSREHFVDALTAAVTEWVDKTGAGAAAYRSSDDFNIGDLSHHLGVSLDGGLKNFLKKHGITGLEVDTYSDSDRLDMTYDTVLIDEAQMTDKVDHDDE